MRVLKVSIAAMALLGLIASSHAGDSSFMIATGNARAVGDGEVKVYTNDVLAEMYGAETPGGGPIEAAPLAPQTPVPAPVTTSLTLPPSYTPPAPQPALGCHADLSVRRSRVDREGNVSNHRFGADIRVREDCAQVFFDLVTRESGPDGAILTQRKPRRLVLRNGATTLLIEHHTSNRLIDWRGELTDCRLCS